MQAAYLFNWSGQPWETQYWAREIMDAFYGTTPEKGYQGDEDEGQMSAWFGSPLFEKAVIHLDKKYYPGGTFTIEARNNSKEIRYIQSAVLNGKTLAKPWFYHSEFVAGGSLVLTMGPKPNQEWGITW